MSLLLEALKKAEKAKEEAQRKAGGEPAPTSPTSSPAPASSAPAAAPTRPAARRELSLQDDAPADKPVVTRSQLPDIHQPLEILTEDIAPSKRPATAAEPKPSPAPKPRPAARAEEAEVGANRASARKVFEAKYREPNPRLPFYLTLGALGVAAIGIVAYFWVQLRPPQLLVNPNPPASQVAAAPAQPAPVAAPVAQAASPAAAPAGIPGLPGSPSAAAPVAAPAPTPAPAAKAPPAPAPRGPKPSAIPVDRPAPRLAAPAREVSVRATAAQSEPQLSIARPHAQVHPRVEAGYAAYMRGDVDAARTAYEAALRDEPANRDALLGLAAIEVRAGRVDAAEAIYRRLLRADPRDPHAQAGLLGLRGGRVDPLAAESRVKTLLAADPNAPVLHFALGNQLSQQGRWPEAQQHYFKAYSADPDQADFAFNLAVSLEHLRQPKLARQYYERAVALAGRHGAGFDLAAAQERIKQLAQ